MTNPTPAPDDGQREVATELRETLADLCHKQWTGWMQYLFSKCYAEDWDGKPHPMTYIPTHLVERWMHQMQTPYAKLSEAEKNSDRTEADKFLSVIAAALAAQRREAEQEQMERDCRAVCKYCDNKYYNSAHQMDGIHWTHTGWDYAFKCSAAPIRAAALESLREQETP